MSLKSIWERRAAQRYRVTVPITINIVVDPAMPKDMIAIVPTSFKKLKPMPPAPATLKMLLSRPLYAPSKPVVFINIADDKVEVK